MCVALLTTNVQLLISKNQQQIPHGNIQIVQRGKIDTRCTYMHNRSHSWLSIYTFKKSGEIEVVLRTKTSPFNENRCSFASAFHM
jgi:ethanolamine utilization protein EutP (predicted NTPase)